MPSLITHYLCGDRWLKKLDNSNMKSILLEHRNVFNIGTQGPDIFFYYRIWPWSKTNGIDKIASKFHNSEVSQVFIEAINYIKEAKCHKELMTSYILGYASHLALDSITHPYIYYMTGFDGAEGFKQKYSCYHSRFEKAIDILMLEKELQLNHLELSIKDLISIKPFEANILGAFYESILLNTFQLQLPPKAVSIAISDMLKVYSLLKDKQGYKMSLFKWLEKKLKHTNYVSSNIYPHRLINSLDYLNLEGKSWHPPWDNTIVRKESFIELFDRAVSETDTLCRNVYQCLEGEKSIEDVIQIIGNRSYLTGINCDLETVMKYHKCIYERLN